MPVRIRRRPTARKELWTPHLTAVSMNRSASIACSLIFSRVHPHCATRRGCPPPPVEITSNAHFLLRVSGCSSAASCKHLRTGTWATQPGARRHHRSSRRCRLPQIFMLSARSRTALRHGDQRAQVTWPLGQYVDSLAFSLPPRPDPSPSSPASQIPPRGAPETITDACGCRDSSPWLRMPFAPSVRHRAACAIGFPGAAESGLVSIDRLGKSTHRFRHHDLRLLLRTTNPQPASLSAIQYQAQRFLSRPWIRSSPTSSARSTHSRQGRRHALVQEPLRSVFRPGVRSEMTQGPAALLPPPWRPT